MQKQTGGSPIITAIETLRVREQPNILWVQIHTDAGIVGLGETYYIPGAVEAVIHDMAAPLLLGKEAFHIEEHWMTLFACTNFYGYAGAEMRAFSALDIALWDIMGQALQQPIHTLLGGACRDRIRTYNTCVNTELFQDSDAFIEQPEALAEDLLAHGISALKIWPWDRFAPQIRSDLTTGPAGWSSMGPVGHSLTLPDLYAGLASVERIRKHVGNKIDILIEGHSRWDLNVAIRIARALEPYNILWMEDIIQPDSVDDLARLVNETRIPQSVSERLFTRYAFREVLERHAAHIAMIDIIWTGGITEARKIAILADSFHLPIAPHDCTGPICIFASLHLCAHAQNTMIMESVRGFYQGWYTDFITTNIIVQDGSIIIPTASGLGTSLRSDIHERPGTTTRISQL